MTARDPISSGEEASPLLEERASVASVETGSWLWDGVRRASAWARQRGVQQATATGASWSLVVRVLGMVVALLVQTVLARQIGRDGYGRYVYVLAWMNMAMLLAKLEFDTLAVRYVAAYSGTQQWSLLKGFVRRTQGITVFLSVSVAAIGAIALYFARAYVDPLLFVAGLWACALLLPSALLGVQSGYLQGFHRMVAAQAPQQLLRPLGFLALLSALIWKLGARVEAWHAVASNLGATVLALAISTWFLQRSMPVAAAGSAPDYDAGAWIVTTRGLIVIAAAQLIVGAQSDVIVVGTLLGLPQAALYSTASQIATLVSFAADAIIAAAIPMVARLHAQRGSRELQPLIRLMFLGTSIVTLPILGVAILFGHRLLSLYGPAFADGYSVLVILSLSHAVIGMVGIMGGYVLTMTGHESQAAKIIVSGALLNLLLTLPLTYFFGVNGTASATLIATALRSAALAFFARRLLAINLVPVR